MMKGWIKDLINWLNGQDQSEPECPSGLFNRKDLVIRLLGKSIRHSNAIIIPVVFWEPVPFFSRKKKVERFGYIVNMASEIFETGDVGEALKLYYIWKEQHEQSLGERTAA